MSEHDALFRSVSDALDGWADRLGLGCGEAGDLAAEAAFAAIEGAGYRVVPVEPTEAMIADGSQARDFPAREGKIVARSVWHNMMRAAPKIGA